MVISRRLMSHRFGRDASEGIGETGHFRTSTD
jgi:hypothetical protein